MKTNLSTFTMNAGFRQDEILIHNLSKYSINFNKVFVCDGAMTNESKEFYSKLPSNVYVTNFEWDNNYEARYRHNASQSGEEEKVLHLDGDEIPSKELIDYIKENDDDPCLMQLIPCVLHIKHENKFYPVEDWPNKEYTGQWTKSILYKTNNQLDFRSFGSHVIGYHKTEELKKYVPHPYFHMKSLESFVLNDVWQAFSSPEGQGYTTDESYLFRSFIGQFKTIQEFKKATQEGSWPIQLQKFVYTKRKEFNRPISRLSWVYYILYNNKCPFGQFDLTWDEVRQHVLSPECMKLLDENIKNNNYFKL